MLTLTWILAGLTVALMVFSVFFVPVVRFGKFQIGGYCFFALLGALALLLTGCVSADAAISGIFGASAVNPIKILVLFLSMTSFSIYLDELGFFRFLAAYAGRRAGASQKTLFFYLYITVSVLTVFTSNDIIILTFTPFVCSFAKNAKIDPLPYLFAEFAAANTWSMALMIGNPTNIYIASFENIVFFDYLRVMILPTVAAGWISLAVLYLLFRRRLDTPMQTEIPPETLGEPALIRIGLIHLLLCILLLTVSSYLHIEMWGVSLLLMVSLFVCVLIYRRVKREKAVILFRTVKRMPWELVPFMLSMFLLVIALKEQGICDSLSALLGERAPVWVYGASSFFTANLINNIPMSVLFATLADAISSSPAAYAAIVGSNLGACLTPVGALAGIMWADILRRNGLPFDFRDFVKYGSAVSIPALAAALAVLTLTV